MSPPSRRTQPKIRKTKRRDPRKRRSRKKKKDYGGISKVVQVDDALFNIIKVRECSRSEIVKRVWRYVRRHNLQDPTDGRFFCPDHKLSQVMGEVGERQNGFKMNKFIKEHIITPQPAFTFD